MERCQHGDKDAFRGIVERHQEYAFALAFRMLCESEESRDVTQESFIRVWTHRGDYRPGVKFTTWLYKIVVNLCKDRLRARLRREQIFQRSNDVVLEGATMSGDNPEEAAMHQDLADRILALTTTLPDKQRTVFILRDLHDQSVEEVSVILGMSPASVRTNLCYARAAIRARLEETKKG
jgi:RNA polymerase sigma-70 factor (ECF subfamily)